MFVQEVVSTLEMSLDDAELAEELKASLELLDCEVEYETMRSAIDETMFSIEPPEKDLYDLMAYQIDISPKKTAALLKKLAWHLSGKPTGPGGSRAYSDPRLLHIFRVFLVALCQAVGVEPPEQPTAAVRSTYATTAAWGVHMMLPENITYVAGILKRHGPEERLRLLHAILDEVLLEECASEQHFRSVVGRVANPTPKREMN